MNNQKTSDDVLGEDSPVEIVGLDELEKEEPEDSTVSTSDYGDDVDDTTPAEAEETLEKAGDIIEEATLEQSERSGRRMTDEKEHPGF